MSRERVRTLNYFRKKMQAAVQEMIKHENNSVLREAFERALTNLETVPINFYPKDSLSRTVFQIGKHFIASEVLGEHKQNIRLVRQGGLLKVVPEGRLIEIPADHFFHGNIPSWEGMKTLMHEICHDPTRNVFEFSREIHLTPNQAEELIADLMSAKIAVRMGFPREKVLSLYHGREGIYGRFPYRKAIEKATEPKKITKIMKKARELPKKFREKTRRKPGFIPRFA
ncbi:MAG: hypothetical protein ABH986_03035 [archaeon]